MFEVNKKEIQWGKNKLIIETGKIARQALSSVVVTYGDTKVMANVTAKSQVNPEIDFFPLTVNYQEKFYSVGKIPGGYFKREARPTEKETLISRLIDRPIRPLFHKDFNNETQVICTVLSHDKENDSDIISIIAASAALTLSGLPFLGPIGASKIGIINDELVLNPTISQLKDSNLELVVAGTKQGVLMVESEAEELTEAQMLEAVVFGQKSYQDVLDLIIDLAEQSAKEAWNIQEKNETIKKLPEKISSEFGEEITKAYSNIKKNERTSLLNDIRLKINEKFINEEDFTSVIVGSATKDTEKLIVRNQLLKTKKRIDGRDSKSIRPIETEVGLLPRAHGSALFTRGETQALVVTTLGTGQDEQIIDAIEGELKQNFMLHYNFPPYSVGEVGRIGTGRREIGHGKLAWRSIHPVLPKKDEFPYTFRVVSEITESNGSSSMATVCGTSLSMMDAGVPIKKPVAGIAMGLIKEDKDFIILSDILGDEDHLGDMDFKVAGTNDGITSLQMDIKITSINEKIMKQALDQAKEGRLHILNEMKKTIEKHREKISDYAPQIKKIKVNKDKIRDVIGKGGSVIREITEKTGAKVEIDDEGNVSIASVGSSAGESALEWIKSIVEEPEIGKIYEGKVVKIVEFGAFVNILKGTDGLVHISQIKSERVEKVEDVLSEGDVVKVKVLDVDGRGKIKLSMKSVDE
tara:strand:- start:3320 stop:5401 length:2082 start_codon:yes stop_codon:yes gene_type:complete